MKKMMGEGALASAQMSTCAAAQARSAGKRSVHADRSRSFIGKGLTTFRMLEREGSMIGCPLLDGLSAKRHSSRIIPFTVEALKLSQLLYIEAKALITALQSISASERDVALRAIAASHKMHLSSLKLEVSEQLEEAAKAPQPQPASPQPSSAQQAAEEKKEEYAAATRLDEACTDTLTQLKSMSMSTSCLPDLVKRLQSTPYTAATAPAPCNATAPAPSPAAAAPSPSTASTTLRRRPSIDTAASTPLPEEEEVMEARAPAPLPSQAPAPAPAAQEAPAPAVEGGGGGGGGGIHFLGRGRGRCEGCGTNSLIRGARAA